MRSGVDADQAAPLKPCAITYHSDESLRLAGGLACLTVGKWRLSRASSSVSVPPASTLATKAPPGASVVDREVGGGLDQAHRAQVVGLLVADGVGGHVRQHQVGRRRRAPLRAAPGASSAMKSICEDGHAFERLGRRAGRCRRPRALGARWRTTWLQPPGAMPRSTTRVDALEQAEALVELGQLVGRAAAIAFGLGLLDVRIVELARQPARRATRCALARS